jgi:deoxyadenosine/deoxycytidine kinase
MTDKAVSRPASKPVLRTVRIEFAGSIAAGKSTLCDHFEARGVPVVREKIAENPFLAKTFADSARRGFYVQNAFLLSKCAAIEEKREPRPELLVCDYALVTEYAYAAIHLAGTDPAGHKASVGLIDMMRGRLGDADLVVWVKTSPQEQLARIRQRMKGNPERDFEKAYTLEYLARLNAIIAGEMAEYRRQGGKVLEIDGEAVDLRAQQVREELYSRIRKEAGLKP